MASYGEITKVPAPKGAPKTLTYQVIVRDRESVDEVKTTMEQVLGALGRIKLIKWKEL